MDCEFLRQAGVRLKVLRLDLVHPSLGGNKWFKLALNIQAIIEAGRPLAVSFGGAWSNHLRALAAAGREFGFPTLGFVRGEIPPNLNPVLKFARDNGMVLRPLSRADYRRKDEPAFLESLTRDLPAPIVLPEGGSNRLAVTGCREIANYLKWEAAPDRRVVALAAGTGGTLAGVLEGMALQSMSARLLGVAVLKAPGYLQRQVSQLAETDAAASVDWDILDDYHCGGYARQSPALIAFIKAFAATTAISLEPVYSGKLFYGLKQEIAAGRIAAGTEIIAIHSGGCHDGTTSAPGPD